MKKKLQIVLIVLLALFLLVPRVDGIDDGGSVAYVAPLYCVTQYHKMDPWNSGEYIEGLGNTIFGIEVYYSEELAAAFQ